MGQFMNKFKQLRMGNSLTQQQIAEQLGISRSAIGMYENGEREPSFELLETIADYFNVDMNYLLGKKAIAESIPNADYIDRMNRNISECDNIDSYISDMLSRIEVIYKEQHYEERLKRLKLYMHYFSRLAKMSDSQIKKVNNILDILDNENN